MKKMKKMHIIVILIVVAVFTAGTLMMNALGVSLFGMFIEKPDIKEVDSEQLLQVKQTYLDMKMESGYPDSMTTEDVFIEEYCGTYNGCIVMMFTDSEAIYAQAVRVVNVAGVRIRYNDANEIYAWNDGEMYTLEQAYVAGILSKSDIKNIRAIHNQYE